MSLGLLVGRFGNLVRENYTPAAAAIAEAPFPANLVHLREKVGHHLIPLVLIARSDREFLDSEREVIFEHCAQIARRSGLEIDRAASAQLCNYIETFHPTLMQLDPALHRLARCAHDEVASLLKAAEAVMLADGVTSPEETRLLAELREELPALDGA